MFPLTALLDIGGKILDKVFPDQAQAEQAKLKLLEMQQSGELARMAADTAEQQELTKRHEADMASDSWLSKNIRPMMLIALFVAYVGFALASVFDLDTKTAYVDLLGQWGMLAFGFYFGSRGAEKVAEIWSKKNGN